MFAKAKKIIKKPKTPKFISKIGRKISSNKVFKKIVKPFKVIGGYFKGAWVELKMVRWPTRKSTWGMTLAVILFSGFFVILIILLDIGFKELFETFIFKK